METNNTKIWEDFWIPTMCGRCYALCGIRVHRVNGVAVEIQGEPNSTFGAEGGLCPKGLSSLQVLYDPNRLNVPLRRTNPEKGIGIDPKWQEITWEEAYAEIIPRMKKIIENNPRKMVFQTGIPSQPLRISQAMSVAGPFMWWFASGLGLHCGNGAHPVGGLIHGSWSIVPDFKYCNYALYFGASKGHGSGHSAMITARMAAEARARGMKMVVFDPICNFAAGKATEWVPIIPGTDAAVILAMCNIMVNELGIIDKPFLQLKTNAPYLVGPDMKYVREKGPARGVQGHASGMGGPAGEAATYIGDDETNKPMVWDAGEGKAKVYDDPTIKEYALEGSYEYRGIKCQPSFALLKEHLKTYTPEMASKASTVPVETIRRIATEFATEARVGSTITIDGHTLPYRPVSAIIFRGGQGHENSYHTCYAVNLISTLVGAVEVPGGTSSWPPVSSGYPGVPGPTSLDYTVFKGLDGFLQNQRFGPSSGASNPKLPYHGEWPIKMPTMSHDPLLLDIQPIGMFKYIVAGSDREEVWNKVGAPAYDVDMLVTCSSNILMSIGNRDSVANALKHVPFIISIDVFSSETAEGFADILLPDTSYLEDSQWTYGLAQNFNHAWGMDDWSYHMAVQPVVKPIGQRKSSFDVGLEILKRLGKEWGRDLIAQANAQFNIMWPIKEEYQLKPTDWPSLAEVGDRVCKSIFGPEHDWEWFKKNGFLRWPKKVEEAYWIWYLPLRVPIYAEYLVHMGEAVEKINKETGIGIDTSQYTPLISWFPCTNHKLNDPNYDLYCYSYRDVLHSASSTMEQPWIDEASRMNPYTYNITMNAATGRKKGLKDGDAVELETYQGRKVTGTVKLLEGQHPQTIGIAATAGHWAIGQPIARGKGANFDTLLPMDFEHMDPVCGNIETSVRVKVRKIEK